jgi:aerobic C4-dicarboxylate transport protein
MSSSSIGVVQVAGTSRKRAFFSSLLFRVTVGMLIGVALGVLAPEVAKALRPLGMGFIKMIRFVIAPIIFGTVVVGIAKMGDMKKVGRVGVKALIYFEVLTTFAMVIGLVMVNWLQPGVGINADPKSLDVGQIAKFTEGAKHLSTADFLMNVIPDTVFDAFTKGDILQVLFFAVLFGMSMAALGEKGKRVVDLIDEVTQGFFKCIHYIMQLAPVGAGAAIAFAVAKFGTSTLSGLGELLLGVWGTAFLFVTVVLGLVCKLAGFSLWKLFKYISEEFFIVLGTSSSETVLPRLMRKLENLGIQPGVVGLVIPTGYSFNLDGTSIYLTMAAVFIAQAFNIKLSIGEQLTILLVLLLTSKGAAAVAGGGFICLAATLASLHTLPVSGLVLLLGVDWFMATCRALTNMIGNAVACVIVAKWEKSVNMTRLEAVLSGKYVVADFDEREAGLVAADEDEDEEAALATPTMA